MCVGKILYKAIRTKFFPYLVITDLEYTRLGGVRVPKGQEPFTDDDPIAFYEAGHTLF